jgi:uncharacterized repeat protein (TIGR02543 family)
MKRIVIALLGLTAVALAACSSPDTASQAAKDTPTTNSPTYTITYDGNGNGSGTAPVDTTAYANGASATVAANDGNLANAGYAFDGWNTVKDGSGTGYAPGAKLTIAGANVTLYAQWAKLYTVTYDANGGSGSVPTDSTGYRSDGIVTVKGNTGGLALSGYSFAGWNSKANGSGTSYTEGKTFKIGSANATLYAVWTKLPTYTVTYDKNGATSGSVPTDSTAYLSGATVYVPGNTGNLALSGYSFAGWNAEKDGSGAVTYTAGESFAMGSKDVTLYAKWTALPTYTVTYHKNGADETVGTDVPADGTHYLSGDKATVLGNTGNLEKAGYAFKGWNDAESGNGTRYVEHDEVPISGANVDLWAIWESTTGSVAISVTTAPIAISLDAPATAVQGIAFSATATVDATIDTWQWYIDGVCISDQTTTSFTGGASLALGPHTIMAEATKDGVNYSRSGRILIQAQ